MTLISVLLALVVDHMLFFHRDSAVAGWYRRYAELVTRRVPARWEGVGGILAIVLPPAIAMLLIQWAAASLLFGLGSLVLGVVVLLFSLGPLDAVNLTEDYIDASRSDDTERSQWYFEQLTGEVPPASRAEEGRRMLAAVLYQGHDNLFATVFWFCVLGPAGAVLYRTAAELALVPGEFVTERPALQRAASFVAGALGWIPARLIAFGYAMTGSFEEALGRLRSGFHTNEDLLAANRRLLVDTGTAALRRDRASRDEEAESAGERRSNEPADVAAAARGLALRTAVLWLAVLALLTLGGWFG